MTTKLRTAESLSPKKRQLLELLVEERRRERRSSRGGPSAPGGRPAIEPRRSSEPRVLSFGQERLWFLEQLEPERAAYRIPAAVRLEGPLRAAVMTRAIREIVRRHETLRCRFETSDGRPRPVIRSHWPFTPGLVDLARLSRPERERAAQQLVAAEASRPFDLERGPLFHIQLLRLEPDHHVLLLVLHHTISDTWSIGVFIRETAVLYEAFSEDRPRPLPDLPVQYSDFAAWQRRWIRGEVLEEQLAYWRRQLEGVEPVLDLPTDRPRPPVQTFAGRREYMVLGRRLTAGIQGLARREEVSPFMAVLAALATLLFRYTGQDDVLVGTPYSNRNQREVEGLIGFFVNTLVLRSRFGDDPPFRRLLARAREVTLGAFAHSDVPLERIVEDLNLERDLSRNPLWQVDLAFQNAPMPELKVAGLRLSRFEVEEHASRFDLEIDLRETEQGYSGWIGYNRDLFIPSTVARMVAHFRALLEAVVERPGLRATEIPLLAAAERREILASSAPAQRVEPGVESVHQLFLEQARRRPDAIAVAQGGVQLSYGEVARRADRLARRLGRRGVGPGSRAGLFLERSPELVVAILGVLRAGAAYVALDPAYPRDRLRYIVDDTRVPVLVTQEHLRPRLPSTPGEVLVLGRGDGELAGVAPARDPVPPAVTGEDLAYVIYTSGSTGRPKGVLVSHRNVVRLLAATEDEFGFGPDDVWTLFHSCAFDFSVWELWGALAYGGRLVVVPYWESRSPESMVSLVEAERVTIFNQTPSAFQQWRRAEADAGGPPGGLPLRRVIFGGEALETRTLAGWFARHGDRRPRLVNMYGITETTVHVTSRVLSAADVAGAPGSVVGRQIDDLGLYVLDRRFEPAPVGVRGEIHVGGAGLARGYFGRPALTAERFVADPFGATPGGRLYRSGDLARRLSDGDLHYLGRADRQVKIRGFRIELGEIEVALADHPAVREVVVLPRETGQRLTGYVVSDREPPPTVDELRDFLKEKLPEYMVPSAFVHLERLPLTAHGKLDRRALPDPAPDRPDLGVEFAAPRGPVEEGLAEIWSGVLGVERVGANDDFFQLGGQSLLATRVVSRIQSTFGTGLSLRSLFQNPTVRRLAREVEAARAAPGRRAAPPITPVPRDGELPLSFAQERLWFIHQLTPDISAYNIPGAVRLTGELAPRTLERAFNAIARRHEVLRTTFSSVGGRPVQVIHPEPDLAIPVVDLRALPGARREVESDRLANREARRPFDLARGPLVRGVLLRLGREEHLLVLNIHHIVYDMWSRVIFIRELGALYEAFAAGRRSPLAELGLQYADFAHWQRRWLTGEVLEEQLAYWKAELEGIPPALEIPTDRPRPAAPSFRGARTFVELPRELSRRLEAFGRERGLTLFITLLSGFFALVHRISGQGDVVVGSPIANRNRTEIEGLMGFFANTLILRGRLSAATGFDALLDQVQGTALGAYAHQDLAFERVVSELQPARDQGRNPLVQVLFNFIQNYRPPDMVLGNLRLSPGWVHNGSSAFDFTLSLWEVDGRLAGAMDYSVDLFDATTTRRFLGHYQALLESAVRRPDAPLAELELWTPEQRQQVLLEWNDTAAPLPWSGGVHRLVEERADRDPETVAVTAGHRALSYGELDRRASRWAARLAAMGCGNGGIVALHLSRSPEMVVAILGALKAGAAYLPLDPAYPEERLAYMVADSGARLVVGERGAAELPSAGGARRLSVEDMETGPGGSRAATVDADPRTAAYVIYTSGSSGRPKGVEVSCGNLVASTAARLHHYRDGVGRFFLLPSFAFDSSVAGLFGTLCHGGTLVLAPSSSEAESVALGELLERERISHLLCVPSLYGVLLEQGAGRALEAVVVAGEPCPPGLVERHFEARPEVRLWNEYGPTEATVWCTVDAPVPEDAPPSAPIGRPILNARCHVLDAVGQPLPAGVPGELFVGGPGVARGYLGRPRLTAERFVPDRFGPDPGGRLYRTGDLVRPLPDGRLQFLARVDHQVKIRGFRIELEEVEAALAAHPRVREAAVVAVEARRPERRSEGAGNGSRGGGAGGFDHLVAYVTFDEGPEEESAELRRFLRRRLPRHMVPADFVALETMPRTATGKVDRRQLRSLEGRSLREERPFVAPSNPVEARLASIWSELLDVDRVSLHDSFFELGGHSLLVTQLVSRLRDAFELEVPLQTFFEEPTLAALAETVEVAAWSREVGREPMEEAAELEVGEI